MGSSAWKSYLCTDAGTEYCPCYLGDMGRCINCAQLAGLELCDCEWSGTCVYCHYKTKNHELVHLRKEMEVAIKKSEQLTPDVRIVVVELDRPLVFELSQYGAYAFLRKKDAPAFFNVPTSVMDVEASRNQISFAFQRIGTKTESLMGARGSVILTAPFWNGILGVRYLRRAVGWNVLIVAKGIAQAAAVIMTKRLLKSGNKVIYAVGAGDIGLTFTADIVASMGATVLKMPREKDHNGEALLDLLNRHPFDLVVSLGSDAQHEQLHQLTKQAVRRPRLCVSNNAVLCCGEGVCGSCTVTINGMTIRRCKASLDPKAANT
ncbi:MAG TPA: hypothetical protein GXX40_09485 [Firmicutes bacterium]|nr:hypothetical protein [Bacillota bacterium]